jgi:hypothetical protein
VAFEIDYAEPKNIAVQTVDHVPRFLEYDGTAKWSTGMAASYTYRRSFYVTHSVVMEYRNSTVADTVSKLNPTYYGDDARQQTFAGLSYQFSSDHRDVIAYPLKGFHYSGGLSQTGLGIGKVNMFEVNALVAQHYTLGKGFFLSNFTSGYYSTPSSQPYSLYNALGYRRQFIRGFETFLIEGPKFFLNKTTLKYRLFSRSWSIEDSPVEQFRYFPIAIYLKVYYDFGYVENYPHYEDIGRNLRLSNRYLQGTGVGIDLVTIYDNVFRFEYTFTREGRTGFFFNVRKEF